MKRFFLILCLLLLFSRISFAAQAIITVADGNACMGEDKSRRQTEQAALIDAKQRAVEFASTHIQGETQVSNFQLKKDLLLAYTNADVRIIQEIKKSWYKDVAMGDCYKIKIKAEVIPSTMPVKTSNPENDNTQFYKLEEQCHEKASQRFNEGINTNFFPFSDYRNHYNRARGKCYMLARYKREFKEDFIVMLQDVNEGSVSYCTQGNGGEYVRSCKSAEWVALLHETMEE